MREGAEALGTGMSSGIASLSNAHPGHVEEDAFAEVEAHCQFGPDLGPGMTGT